LKLLEAAVEQGVDDEETQVALAVARFGLARSNGAVQDMEAAAEILREHLPAISAARVLAATGGQQLKDASAAAVQHRRNHVSVERVRTTVTPLLRTAADMLSEALLLDGTQFSIHYLLGLLAYRLLGDVELAFVHLHEAQRLAPSDWSLPDRILGEISLQADQIFLAKRLLFNSWRSGQGSERLSDMLRSVMNREEELLNRFSQEREDTSEPGIDEVEDIVMRARMLNQVIAQVVEALPPDRQAVVRDLALQLKRALLEKEQAKLEELENALLSELGPLLFKES
jgi:tetratricopeptide (TPR) repeat protein